MPQLNTILTIFTFSALLWLTACQTPQDTTTNTTADTTQPAAGQRWSEERAQAWYDEQPWLVGCNFIPSNAINQL